MKKSIDILINYLTCEDPVIKSKWLDILQSFYHKDNGQLITGYTTAENGDITMSFTDGASLTIEKFIMPNTMPLNFIDGLVGLLNGKVDKVTGKQLSDENFTLLLKQKLEQLQNYVHPDTHSISEVQGLQGALDGKVDKVIGKQLTDENFTTQEKTKLNGLENYNPPASQPKSYIQGLEDDLTQINQDISGKVDKVDGKELSSNDYTDADKTKLNGLNPLAFKTISDGNGNNIVAEAQDDELTIEGATLDIENKKIIIGSSASTFSDENGNTKYQSNEDKRTGYYDTTNKVYYPDIKVYKTGVGKTVYGNGNTAGGSIIEDAFFMLSPKDASYMTQQSGGSATGYYCLKFPNIPKNAFSFELDIQGNFDGGSNTNFQDFCRVKVSVGNVSVNNNISTWSNAKIEFIDNSSDIIWEFYLVDDLDGNLIVALKQKDITSSYYMNVRLNNLLLSNVWNGGNNPLNFYTGWEGFTFNSYYGFNNFRIRETISLKKENFPISINDKNNTTKYEITDSLRFGEGFKFNSAEKELEVDTDNFVLTSFKNTAILLNYTSNILSNTSERASQTFGIIFNEKTRFNIKTFNSFIYRNGGYDGKILPTKIILRVFLEATNCVFNNADANILLYEIVNTDTASINDNAIMGNSFIVPVISNRSVSSTTWDRLDVVQKTYDQIGNVLSSSLDSYTGQSTGYSGNASLGDMLANQITFNLVTELVFEYADATNATLNNSKKSTIARHLYTQIESI
ncbi:hypothetical protein PL373_07875 [Tenacibaculum maritimum]|nr:hypothetical protein [Tenacibaculum maritimum]